MNFSYQSLYRSLTPVYGQDEARAVVRWLLEVAFGMTLSDILGGALERMDASEKERLQQMMKRLEKGEPVQYVAGRADFGPRQFFVAPGVLIPRPETYELCRWIADDQETKHKNTTSTEQLTVPTTILDIGTGSGCIACTLATDISGSKLTAWDISPEALDIARRNAEMLGVDIHFEQRDMLQQPYNEFGLWDVVVSNPPYICDSEAEEMDDWVLDYEPEEALFVPDDDPTLFYLQISNYAQSALKEGGRLYFEINPLYDEAIEDILLGLGFDDIIVRNDQYGRSRFMRATWH